MFGTGLRCWFGIMPRDMHRVNVQSKCAHTQPSEAERGKELLQQA